MIHKLKLLWYTVDGYKTYGIALITIVYALVVTGYQQHDWSTAITVCLGASGLGALRHGISKSE